MTIRTRIIALAAASLASSAIGLAQGFTDTFDSINPSWVTDRYAPAGFNSVSFDGGNRLQLSISAADSYQNRSAGYQSTFYNTQGRQRSTSLGPNWVVSGDVYISNDMLSGNNLRRTDLWARDNNPVENNAAYPILGVIRNDANDPFNPGGSLSTRYRVWDAETANGWVDLGATVTAGWHNMAIYGTGTSFVYQIDGSTVYTDNDASALGFEGLQTVFVQAYSFGDATHATTDNYSVYWDNITAAPVPEPASLAAVGLGIVGVIRRRRAKKA